MKQRENVKIIRRLAEQALAAHYALIAEGDTESAECIEQMIDTLSEGNGFGLCHECRAITARTIDSNGCNRCASCLLAEDYHRECEQDESWLWERR